MKCELKTRPNKDADQINEKFSRGSSCMNLRRQSALALLASMLDHKRSSVLLQNRYGEFSELVSIITKAEPL
jgi:formyltetrahydrofolate hydrolase